MNRETSRNLENKKHACFTGITKISIKCNLCHIHYISIMFLNHLANMFLESPLIFLGHLATKSRLSQHPQSSAKVIGIP